MKDRGPERQAMTDRVVAAIQAVYRARNAPGDDKAILLHKGREVERDAERELNAHVKACLLTLPEPGL